MVLFGVAAVIFVAALKALNLPARFNRAELIDAFSTGARYALAVGAAAGTVAGPALVQMGVGPIVAHVFGFSPALLLVTKDFTWSAFAVVFTACIASILLLAAALLRYLEVEIKGADRALAFVAALTMIAPGVNMLLLVLVLALALAAPMLIIQCLRLRTT